MAKSFSGGIRGLRALISGFGTVVLTTALLLPGSAGAQAVVNTVKLGACDDLLGVCLANPTQRYKHGVFGQPFEYGTILTIDENGAALRPYNLPFEQVFEDRRVRVVDLDDDGLSEVILIVADRNRGAAVALYAFDPGDDGNSATVYPMAQSAFIGAPNRWLNPLDGAVDLDGDGSREIAVIETPHIAPTLRVHQWNGGQLDTLARIPLGGYSNHAFGSLQLAGSLFCEADVPGRALVQIPSGDGGPAGVFIFDLADGTLRLTELQPTDLYTADFFIQNRACAALLQQLG